MPTPFIQGLAVQWYADSGDVLGVGAYQAALLNLVPPDIGAEGDARTVRVLSGFFPSSPPRPFLTDRLRLDVQSIRGSGALPLVTLEVWSGIVCNGGSVLNFRGTWTPTDWGDSGMVVEVFGFLATDWEIRLGQSTDTMSALVLACAADRAGGATAGFVTGQNWTSKGGVHFP